METDFRVLFEKLLHRFGLVRREIVQHDVNLSRPARLFEQTTQKEQELSTGVPFCCLAFDPSGLHVQGGVEGQRAMTVILKSMSFRSSRRQRQHRIESIQRLNRSFFVHAEHRRMLPWVEIETDDI